MASNMFKVGDVVRRFEGEYDGMKLGDHGTVTGLCQDGQHMTLQGHGTRGHGMNHFELASTEASIDVWLEENP